MGLNWPDVSFLLAARELGVSFERTLTIGRQNLFADARDLARGYAECGLEISPDTARAVVEDGDGFADPLLRRLGAQQIDSLDASGFEGSSVVHDLNTPLPSDFEAKYTLVFDGGSLEHVFNYPQAIKSCMSAVAVGGHFAAATPANNAVGHGFYQFSPELLYRVLSPDNGFRVVLMLVRADHRWARWYSVSDPAVVGERVTMTNGWFTLLYVLAQRTALTEPLSEAPQQSDYAAAWERPDQQHHGLSRGARIQARLPTPARRAIRLASALTGTKSGPEHFQRVEMSEVMASGRH